MAEVQDEETWLYGDDKDESNIEEREKEAEAAEGAEPREPPDAEVPSKEPTETETPTEEETAETNGVVNESVEPIPEESQDAEQNGDKPKDDAGEDSSSDDEPTITIGKIVKQPDILRPPPPTHRAAPTSGLKDDDFTSVGKVNGIPITDFNLAELEEKPWRKPGADLSDYFNYGFTEDTWIKYCERQKAMRTNESGIGLTGLGINVAKGMLGSSNIPVSIVNENSKYGGGIRKPAGMPLVNRTEEENNSAGSQLSTINTIQVMTADRRTYSNKVMGSGGPGGNYDDMDFGGHPYGADFFSAPPPSFYTPPPPGPWGGGVPNVPPPGWMPDGMGVPPPPPPHHRGSMGGYFDEDSLGPHSRSSKDDRDLEKMRDSRDRDHDESRERESRHHSSRRRSRSQSKSRHRKRSRTRSRSRSPSHRHKRKKSKREREMD